MDVKNGSNNLNRVDTLNPTDQQHKTAGTFFYNDS